MATDASVPIRVAMHEPLSRGLAGRMLGMTKV
jgi:hypothetical protein